MTQPKTPEDMKRQKCPTCDYRAYGMSRQAVMEALMDHLEHKDWLKELEKETL